MSNANTTSATSSTSVPSATPAAAAPTKSVDIKPQSSGTANAASQAPAVTPQSEEKFEVTIDGKKELKTRKEIIEAYQLRQLSDKKRSEADQVLTQYKKLQEVAKQDPIKFMKAMGYDFDGLATSYLAKKAEDSMKDPKVLEAEKLKAENEQYKQWVEQQKALQNQKAKQEAINAERSRLHKEIIEAIEEKKELGLPIDEHLIIQIAQDMMVQDKAKKPLNAKEALPATYARTQKWLQGLASKMDGEAIVKWLGEDVAKKIRKYDLTQLKAKRSVPQPASNVKPQSEKTPTPVKPYKTWSEFKKEKLDTIK